MKWANSHYHSRNEAFKIIEKQWLKRKENKIFVPLEAEGKKSKKADYKCEGREIGMIWGKQWRFGEANGYNHIYNQKGIWVFLKWKEITQKVIKLSSAISSSYLGVWVRDFESLFHIVYLFIFQLGVHKA